MLLIDFKAVFIFIFLVEEGSRGRDPREKVKLKTNYETKFYKFRVTLYKNGKKFNAKIIFRVDTSNFFQNNLIWA